MKNARLNKSEAGAATVLFAILAVVVFGMAAFAIDIATLGQQRQQLWNTTDSAALAGVSALPGSFKEAESRAIAMALANDPSLDAEDISIEYRCLVGDRDGDGQPDEEDIPRSCDPGKDVAISAPPYICEDGECFSPCDPGEGDLCNTMIVSGTKVVDFTFAPVIGIQDEDTDVLSAACVGFCGKSPTEPIDLAIIIDRTGSMSAADLANVKEATLAVLALLDDSKHHVALGTLGAADPSNLCQHRDPAAGGQWLAVGLGGGYKTNPDLDVTGDGVPDLASANKLVSTVRCLATSSQGTNLGSPLKDDAFGAPDAVTELIKNGRPGVKKAILFMTDGEANQPAAYAPNTCQFAYDMAVATRRAGIELFTVGFGIDGVDCDDPSGSYSGDEVTELLADMATQPSDDDCDSTSSSNIENVDGDHFFCQPKSEELKDSFIRITEALLPGAKLVGIPPGA